MKQTEPRRYKIVKTTAEENTEFIDLMESTIDKAEQAIDHITYSCFPEINAELRKQIQKACRILEDTLESEVYRPVKE